MELMTEKHKHCVNPGHSCRTKAAGLNFNPRKSWKNAFLSRRVDTRDGPRRAAACGNQHPVGGGDALPKHHEDGKSEEVEGRTGRKGKESAKRIQQSAAGMKYSPFWIYSADLKAKRVSENVPPA